jgi:hypothetical protein
MFRNGTGVGFSCLYFDYKLEKNILTGGSSIYRFGSGTSGMMEKICKEDNSDYRTGTLIFADCHWTNQRYKR